MPISAIGTLTDTSVSSNPQLRLGQQTGFTLLELLVVVAIIGIFAGALVFSMNITGSDREVEQEARRLQGLLGLLREEALMQNRDFGVAFTETGYRFYTYDYQRLSWLPPLNDEMFNERMLEEPLSIDLRVDDRDITLEQEFEHAYYDEEDVEPQVLVLATGEISPFSVVFERGFNAAGGISVSGSLTGKLEVARLGNDAR